MTGRRSGRSMRRALAALLLAGCAASQPSAVAGYVHATKAVVDVSLATYVEMAEQRMSGCEVHQDAAAFVECMGPLANAHEVAVAARALAAAQEAFVAAYNARDLHGIARALERLRHLAGYLQELLR